MNLHMLCAICNQSHNKFITHSVSEVYYREREKQTKTNEKRVYDKGNILATHISPFIRNYKHKYDVVKQNYEKII